MNFEWDDVKDQINTEKHGVSFFKAQFAFADGKRLILLDRLHSGNNEKRYFCLGQVEGRVLTVRFTYRDGNIRIFGAGFWRKGKSEYEKKNKIR